MAFKLPNSRGMLPVSKLLSEYNWTMCNSSVLSIDPLSQQIAFHKVEHLLRLVNWPSSEGSGPDSVLLPRNIYTVSNKIMEEQKLGMKMRAAALAC